MARAISTKQLLAGLKAAGEATRLRILALLAMGELNVSDLTHILDQSQPRISRHLRLLAEAGLIERFREGSFVYCRLAQGEIIGELVNQAIALVDPTDPDLHDDRLRALKIQEERIKASQIWFKANAAKWDQIRSLYVAESRVEAAMQELLQMDQPDEPCRLLFDLGTGTGRMLELFAQQAQQLIGIDTSHSMLEYARSRLKGKGFEHCQVRQGDVINLPYEDGLADIAILHQVLHYLIAPKKALTEAARLLRPGGRLLIVDFAPHGLDFLREEFAHERLGFARQQMTNWLKKAGLTPKQYIELAADDHASEGGHEQKLSISLWLAEKTASVTRKMSVPSKSNVTGRDLHNRKNKVHGSAK